LKGEIKMDGYKVLIEGYDANAITNKIVEKIIQTFDLDKLKNEVRNKIVQELKSDIVNSSRVKQAIDEAINKVDRISTDRVSKAITEKISEINEMNIGTFKLVRE
jgi:hypothetical protein